MTECDPNDRSGDPIAPIYHGISCHAALIKKIACPGCKRTGLVRENGYGATPPHGWWIETRPDRVSPRDADYFCSSECIASYRRSIGRV